MSDESRERMPRTVAVDHRSLASGQLIRGAQPIAVTRGSSIAFRAPTTGASSGCASAPRGTVCSPTSTQRSSAQRRIVAPLDAGEADTFVRLLARLVERDNEWSRAPARHGGASLPVAQGA
ncbi:MAG: hypothetical protein M9885_01255 [Burkholderiaceae bacterium]|nr:hypothetical protein [Burkholderiaceae bacterium]